MVFRTAGAAGPETENLRWRGAERLCAARLRPAAGIRPPSVLKPPLGLPDQPRRAPRLAAAPANAAIARRHVRLDVAVMEWDKVERQGSTRLSNAVINLLLFSKAHCWFIWSLGKGVSVPP